MAPRSYGLWPHHIRYNFVPQIDRHAAILRSRVLPAFDSIDIEARKVEAESYRQLIARSSSEDPDVALYGERAAEEAGDFIHAMLKARQAQINLQTVGLYHLFEQQLFEIHRRLEFLAGRLEPTTEFRLNQVKSVFKADGVEIEKLPAWEKVHELSLVANCAKHGEGHSCQELRQLRPEVLTRPSWRFTAPGQPDPDRVVLNALGGENLYVTLSDFEEYVASVKSFWADLADRLPT